jgi:hypothetical protein
MQFEFAEEVMKVHNTMGIMHRSRFDLGAWGNDT